MPRNIETSFNTLLADILRGKNPLWRVPGALVAEQTGVFSKGGRHPDLVIQAANSAPVIIETEFAPARTVEQDALQRLGTTIRATNRTVEHVIALKIPAAMRDVAQDNLKAMMTTTNYDYCMHSQDAQETGSRWPQTGWVSGNSDDLATLLENAAVSESLIANSMDVLERGIAAAANIFQAGTAQRLDDRRVIAHLLHQQEGQQTSLMAMAILANALTFHEIIAGVHAVKHIAELRDADGIINTRKLSNEWQRILNEVNYWPIFHIAREIIIKIPAQIVAAILVELDKVASNLAAKGVTSSHDLYGRVFQRLISDRKFLATFYTRPESATLLARLAVDRLGCQWQDANQVRELRIADLACGTGTLLAAAYHAILEKHRRTGGNDEELHQGMMEKSLIAADIMPAATHLTTSMLSSIHPTKTFKNTGIYTIPYGTVALANGAEIYIGSLDFLDSEHAVDVLQQGIAIQIVRGDTADQEVAYKATIAENFAMRHASMDLVIMNPPFTRPTNHESATVPVPSFAGFGTSKQEQQYMSERLAKHRKQLTNPAGHGNAGLASNFLDLAHVKLKPGGILALVMPLVLLQGKSWSASRQLLERYYEDILVVTLAAAKARDKSFSADTAMGEVLIVAQKKRETEAENCTTTFVSLQQRPASIVAAVETARQINFLAHNTSQLDHPRDIKIGEEMVGMAIQVTGFDGSYGSIRDHTLLQTAQALQNGYLELPRLKATLPIPMTSLGVIGKSGLLDRDINGAPPRGAFDIVELRSSQATYPVLWNHNTKRERCLIVAPDKQGNVRPDMKMVANNVWETATCLHINRDFGLSSQSLAACMTPSITIGGRAWPNYIMHETKDEFVVVLWLNTTLGLLSFWQLGSKQHPGRAIITISTLAALPVLNPRILTTKQHNQAQKLFTKFAAREFLPANEAYRDQTRQELDRAVLVDLMGFDVSILKPLELLRNKWCAEPSVHGGKSTRIAVE